jgi:hypothetical protein
MFLFLNISPSPVSSTNSKTFSGVSKYESRRTILPSRLKVFAFLSFLTAIKISKTSKTLAFSSNNSSIASLKSFSLSNS